MNIYNRCDDIQALAAISFRIPFRKKTQICAQTGRLIAAPLPLYCCPHPVSHFRSMAMRNFSVSHSFYSKAGCSYHFMLCTPYVLPTLLHQTHITAHSPSMPVISACFARSRESCQQWQRTKCPGSTSVSSGSDSKHLSQLIQQRVAKRH